MLAKSTVIENQNPSFEYEQFREVLLRIQPIKQYICNLESAPQPIHKFLNVLDGRLSLEETTSMYTVSILLFLLGNNKEHYNNNCLELLHKSFTYSDTLKPTMIDFATRDLLDNIKYSTRLDETQTDYMMHLLDVIPHILVTSDTGKMISLSLLRAIMADLSSKPPIVMHIYRNLSEIWHMMKSISLETMLDDWPIRKTYILIKTFTMIMSAAAFNNNNTGLKQAGYRGFELPTNVSEIVEWFKNLKNKLEIKYKDNKAGIKLVFYIDHIVLSSLTKMET